MYFLEMRKMIETILEFDEKGELTVDFYIEVGLVYDKHRIRQKLILKEKDLNLDVIGLDIKNIMHQIKKKLIEEINKEGVNGS